MKELPTGYELSRDFFDWSFENPEKITPTHIALYFFIIEHCNRLGWKEKFGLPTTMAKDAIGIRSYKTYIKALHDLVEWGFIIMVEHSKNQYSSNIVALVKNAKAHTNALTKASPKHIPKQVQSTYQSNDSIYKLLNNEQLNNKSINIDADINEVYKAYPSKCVTKNSLTNKNNKNKEQIKKLLSVRSKDELLKIISLYVSDCKTHNRYMKNFTTFLNNIPDIDEPVINKIPQQERAGWFEVYKPQN